VYVMKWVVHVMKGVVRVTAPFIFYLISILGPPPDWNTTWWSEPDLQHLCGKSEDEP
jgi:hypothetical protein